MVKHSTKEKIEAVEFYLNHPVSVRETAQKFEINSADHLSRWISIYKSEGSLGLKVKRTHQTYSQAFKLNVVKYYQTHETSINLVALEFKLNPSQVRNWVYKFNHYGAEGLLARRRGRKPMKKKTKESSLSKDKEAAYLTEISELKTQITKTEMENDILKKHLASEYGIVLGQNDNWKHK